MTVMMRRIPFAILAVGLLLGLVAVACGGGSDSNAGKGERETDPAKVYTSTPIQNPMIYQIRQDGQVQTSGGQPGTVTSSSQTPGPNSKQQTYTVASGDTCSAIAAKFGISFDELKRANRTIDDGCTNLHAGDALKIPAAATPAATTSTGGLTSGATPKTSGKTFVVLEGNTCSGIAQSYNVPVADLIALNGLDPNCQNLKIGQTLKIP